MRRRIKENRRCSVPGIHVVFDCETVEHPCTLFPSGVKNVLSFGWACRFRLTAGRVTRREWFRFDEGHELWEWVRDGLDPRRRTWVWAHWMSYDATAALLWEELESKRFRAHYRRREAPGNGVARRGDDESGLFCLEDPPTIIDLETADARRVTLVDLMNWLPVSLAEIGKWVGLDKTPLPSELASTEDWDEYCTNDVEIACRAVCRLANLVVGSDLGNMRYTASGQSMALYRHIKKQEQIEWGHPDDAKTLERAAYYSGRSRCYFMGRLGEVAGLHSRPAQAEMAFDDGDETPAVYRLDVNACYPWCMADHDYPVKHMWTESDTPLETLSAYLACYEVVALVRLRRATVPYPRRVDGRTVWATGSFVTTLCGPELRDAVARGFVVQVLQCGVYRRGRPFGEFVARVLSLRATARADGDGIAENVYKLIANALHGKFAQKAGGWVLTRDVVASQPWGVWPDADMDTGKVTMYRSIGWNAEVQVERTEKDDNFPLIAAYCCAYARALMWSYRATAGERHTLYEDADSIHVDAAGFAALDAAGCIHPTRPGALKVVQSAALAEYRGPRYYRLDDQWVCAGISPRAAVDDDGVIRQQAFMRLAAMLNSQPPDGPVKWEYLPTLPDCKQEGSVNPDGWTVFPCDIA